MHIELAGLPVNNPSEQQLSHPVVREVLVHYLPHLCLLGLQYRGAEVQAHIEHGCLVSQCCATMLWQRVRRHLVDRK